MAFLLPIFTAISTFAGSSVLAGIWTASFSTVIGCFLRWGLASITASIMRGGGGGGVGGGSL